MRLATFGLGMALLLSLSTGALALPPDAQKRADEMFQEGRQAMAKSDFRAALKILRTSHELDPTRGKLLNIAVCEERLGLVASALAHLQELDPQIPADDPRRPSVDDYLAKLPARIPHLRIELAVGSPAGSSVTLDGAPIAKEKLGTELPLDAGKYSLVVSAAGRLEKRYEVTVEEGKRVRLVVEVGAAPSPAVLPSAPLPANTSLRPASPGPGERAQRGMVPVVVLGGLGVLGVGAGIVLVGARAAQQSNATELRGGITDVGHCRPDGGNADSAPCPQIASATSTGDGFGTASLVSFIVGGLAGAGALTYAAWPSSGPPAPPRVSFRVAPVVGEHERGIAVWGSF